MTDQKVQKGAAIFECKICDYKSCNQFFINRHFETKKHQILTNTDQKVQKGAEFSCVCGKKYKHKQSLFTHKKICQPISGEQHVELKIEENVEGKKENSFDKEMLIIQLLKQNQELQKSLIDLSKNAVNVNNNNNNNNNNNTNNSHNKTFNLQFFLNEECKDALNISEFVSLIKVELEDLETTGRLGYVEGVSRIMNKNLKELDVNKRPIHCSDLKRETLYIKNDDQWTKEDDTKPILKKAIKQVANENIKKISEWRKKYPDCTDSESRKNDLYLKIVSNSMSGLTTEEQIKNYEKIVSKVLKEAVIDKL
jgi:hypothetical protein